MPIRATGVFKTWTQLLFTVALLCLHERPNPALAAEFTTPTFGGGGGTQAYNLDCGSGAVMVGVMSKSGFWLDAVGIICQSVNAQNGTLGETFTRGTVGGSGGQAKSTQCIPGGVIQRIVVGAGQYVELGTIFCREWLSLQKKPRFSTDRCQAGTCTSFGNLNSMAQRKARSSARMGKPGRPFEEDTGSISIRFDSSVTIGASKSMDYSLDRFQTLIAGTYGFIAMLPR
ncbi:hypothetical protein YTPLAS18_07590 [Nitrospira sp.]|nr:hypothetical protein YTPLAS18_07590 [Nitrospira sp.]